MASFSSNRRNTLMFDTVVSIPLVEIVLRHNDSRVMNISTCDLFTSTRICNVHWTGKTVESETDCHFSELDLTMSEYQSGWVAKSMDGPPPAGRRSTFRNDRGTPTFVRQPTPESVRGETLNTKNDRWNIHVSARSILGDVPTENRPHLCRRRIQRAGKEVGYFAGVSNG